MMSAISFVVVLDDIFDTVKALLARPDVLEELVEVAIGLAPAVADLIMVVTMAWDEIYNNLVGHQVFPVCSSD